MIGPYRSLFPCPSHMSTCTSWFRGKVCRRCLTDAARLAKSCTVINYLTQRHDVDRFYMVGRVPTIQEWVSLSHSVHHSYHGHLMDTSGSWGCGAFINSHWFQVEWPLEWEAHAIACKEMVHVFAAATCTWG